MKKAAIYMRVSTTNQEDEHTVENQRLELMERVRDDGALLLPEHIYVDEGWSGAIIERPALDRMRTDAKDGKFEVLYAYDRGRVSRDFIHQEVILDEIKKSVEFISLHDVNGETSEQILMGRVMGIFHDYERVKIADRMRLGKLRKVRENKMLLGYNPKYGYDYLPRVKKGVDTREGQFVINDAQAKVVLQIFEWAAEGMSKYAIRDALFEQCITPLRAKRETWATSVIDRMLRDTTYKGEHYYNKSESVPTKKRRKYTPYPKILKGSRVIRRKEEWMMVQVPAIVSPELFAAVQEQLGRRKQLNARNNKQHDYLVSGIVECPCGYARTGDPANGHTYYRCNDRFNHSTGTRKCFERSVNGAVLDALVWKNIEKLLTQPELVVEYAKRWEQNSSPYEERLTTIREGLSRLDESERRYAKVLGNGTMTERIYEENMYTLRKSRERLTEQLTAIEIEIAGKKPLPLEKLAGGVIKLVKDMDFAGKKQIIQKVVTKVVATQKEVTVWGHIPTLATGDVGYEPIDRNCGIAECWQVDPI